MKDREVPLNPLALAWPDPAWVRVAAEARGAIAKGLFRPVEKRPEERVPADVATWRHRVRRMHELAAGGGKVKAVPLARVLRRVRVR